jgi:hypothetical protein
MKLSKLVLLLLLSIASFSALADSATNDLKTCIIDNSTGKDHKDLARWIFVAMAAHPEMKDASNVTPEAREAASKKMAALVTRLMTEQCAPQARALFGQGASVTSALATAFGALGQVAMQEMMAEPHVSAATEEFTHYLDKQKFEEALRPK